MIRTGQSREALACFSVSKKSEKYVVIANQ